MSYAGNILLGNTIDVKFTTRNSSGVPTTLAGSPVISAYVGNSTTEITAGITLTVDFDSRTGLNNVRVVASGGNGFTTATDVTLVITTGTVNSVSVVGEVVGEFSIDNRVTDTTKWNGTAVATPDTAGYPKVTVKNGTGTGEIVLTSGVADVRLADAVSHGGTLGSSTATFAISRLNITSQTSNTAGVTIAGNGSGAGMSTTGGLTGIGFSIVGGGTSGDGLSITTSGGHGINVAPAGTSKHALLLTGSSGGTGDALKLVAGTSGVGFRGDTLNFTGAWTIGGALTISSVSVSNNLTVSGTTGFQAVTMTTLNTSGAATLNSLVVSTTAAFTGNVALAAGLNITQSSSNTSAVVITGAGTGDGITVTGGNGLTGSAVALVANSTSGAALRLAGKGAGAGLSATGGLTGNGILVVGGGTSGDGLKITTTSGHGFNSAPVGTGKHGILSTGGNGGTSDGASFVAGTGGVGLRAGTMTVDGAVVFGSTFAIASTMSMSTMSITTSLNISNPGGDSPVLITSADGSPAISIVGSAGINVAGTTMFVGATTFTGTVSATNASNDIRLGGTQNALIGTATWASATRTLSAAGVQAIWDALTSALTTVGSIGKRLVDFVTTLVYAAPPAGADIRSAVGLASANLDTQLDALPTNTELATSQATALTNIRAAQIIDHGAGSYVNSGAGSGAYVVTVIVKDGSAVALQNVLVRLKEGINSFTDTTNASGIATFGLNAATYTESMTKDGYTFTPTSIVVTTDANFNALMTLIVAPTPSAPEKATVTGTLLNGDGSVAANVTGKMTLHAGKNDERPLLSGGNGLTTTVIPFRTNASGVIKADDGTSTLEANRTDYPYMTQADGTEGQPYWQFECDALNVKGRKVFVTTANLDISDLAS